MSFGVEGFEEFKVFEGFKMFEEFEEFEMFEGFEFWKVGGIYFLWLIYRVLAQCPEMFTGINYIQASRVLGKYFFEQLHGFPFVVQLVFEQ